MKKVIFEEIIAKKVSVPDEATDEDVKKLYLSGSMLVESTQLVEVNVLMDGEESFINLL